MLQQQQLIMLQQQQLGTRTLIFDPELSITCNISSLNTCICLFFLYF
jgi:hypothetical protein